MIHIDGSQGEGGGQILRSSLSLAAITGQPLQLTHIRAGRAKPGLQRQHMVAVLAAARACHGQVEGCTMGSSTLTFHPQAPTPGVYEFDIGSAGSTTLVLQTILPILLTASDASTVIIHGGTHNGMAPPVEFLAGSFLPLLHQIGVSATLTLEQHGFYPAGGGRIRAHIQPWSMPIPLDMMERGKVIDRQARILLANLPAHIAQREAQALKQGLQWSRDEVDEIEVSANGPGNAIIAMVRQTHINAVFSAFGDLKTRAEEVSRNVQDQVSRYLDHDAPVCEHLADQLLLPLALGAGGVFRTFAPSEHTRTNAAIVNRFLGDVVGLQDLGAEGTRIQVRGRVS